ncbi:MAG: glycoside hydrolase family 2 TIM barrel-domain containing protein [Propionibacteriaceae bacterium]|nr:glycoside hydrolase family 2 TIM barrel-domain containing protein [Propionibacteriaceae bacterium]
MLVRPEWLCLNGAWEYQLAGPSRRLDGVITVPFAVETAASGVQQACLPEDVLSYSRVVENPWPGRRVLLNFEAVDYRCRVLIDGVLAAEHTGGYLPFSVELLDAPRWQVDVEVTDPSDSGFQQHGKQALEPFGIWYTATSGIWGTVWLEPLPANAVTRVLCEPRRGLDGFDVTVSTELPGRVRVSVGLPDGGEAVVEGRAGVPLRVDLAEPRLWSADDPHLYPVTVTAGEDRVGSWAGLRTVEIGPIPGREGEVPGVLLNGQPVLLNTPLDQGYWPESGMTPPSDAALVHDLSTMKGLGFNGLRMHIKVASRRWYHHADTLGLLVVQDMVSGGKPRVGLKGSGLVQALDLTAEDRSQRAMKAAGRGDEANREEFRRELAEMVELLRVHPSIVCWVPFNEAWGQFDAAGAAEQVRALDPTRLIDHASGWYDQGVGDFRSRHRYVLKLKPPPRRDARPFYLSEFGGYNLAVPGHLWSETERFGYRHFDDEAGLAVGLTKLWRDQLIPLVSRGLRACVYTQVSDVEIETNGLMTYDRKVLKVDAALMRQLNAELYAAFAG